MSIAVVRHAAADAAFGVLAALPLGDDAASIFDDTIPDEAAPWRGALLQAYREDPGRLALHFVGLPPREVSELTARLRDGSVAIGPWRPGARLRHHFADAVADWWQRHEEAWRHDEAEHRARVDAAASWLPTLASLRAALWEERGDAPDLRIVDVAALGPAGRGHGTRQGRLVGTSLAEPPPHPLLQMFHEEVHAAVDPAQPPAGHPVDTRHGAPGHANHLQVERAAIEVGAAVIDARHPELAGGYARWRARIGM